MSSRARSGFVCRLLARRPRRARPRCGVEPGGAAARHRPGGTRGQPIEFSSSVYSVTPRLVQQRVVELDHLGVDRRDRPSRSPRRRAASARGSAPSAARNSGTWARSCTASAAAARGGAVLDVRADRSARSPPGAASASGRPGRRTCTSPSARRPSPHRTCGRRARCPRKRGLDAAVAVERAEPLRLAEREPPERLLGRQDVVRPPRRLELHGARELGQERVARELVAERRRRRRVRGRRPSPAGSAPTSARIEPRSVSQSAPGRSVRPTEPAKRTSPEKRQPSAW